MDQVVIIGAGGFAREVAWLWEDCFEADSSLPRLIGHISPKPSSNTHFPILGDDEWAFNNLNPASTGFILGTGFSELREKLGNLYESRGFKALTLIHPSARIGTNSQIGAGSIICAGNTITVDVNIGAHVLVNLHCTIGHDTGIGDFSVLSPGVHLSGHSQIGKRCELGTGAVTVPGVSIADDIVLGAGTVVHTDLDLPGTYVGVPAKRIS